MPDGRTAVRDNPRMGTALRAAAVAALTVLAAGCATTVAGTGTVAADARAPVGTTATPSPTPGPTPSPTATPSPTPRPTASPTPGPTRDPLAVTRFWSGTWRGTVLQPGSTIPRWTAEVALPFGAVRGRFEIQGQCSGYADVIAISGTKLVLLEEITSDPSGTCADRGTVELVRIGGRDDQVRIVWTDIAQAANSGTGTLKRV